MVLLSYICCLVMVRRIHICIVVDTGIHYSKYGCAWPLPDNILYMTEKPKLLSFILEVVVIGSCRHNGIRHLLPHTADKLVLHNKTFLCCVRFAKVDISLIYLHCATIAKISTGSHHSQLLQKIEWTHNHFIKEWQINSPHLFY